jgi:hypothetical protein
MGYFSHSWIINHDRGAARRHGKAPWTDPGHSRRLGLTLNRDKRPESADFVSPHFNERPEKLVSAREQKGSPFPVEDEMSLSRRSVEMLLDLVEIKISYMDVADREDARDLVVLERCREELRSLTGIPTVAAASVTLSRRVGRPRIAA